MNDKTKQIDEVIEGLNNTHSDGAVYMGHVASHEYGIILEALEYYKAMHTPPQGEAFEALKIMRSKILKHSRSTMSVYENAYDTVYKALSRQTVDVGGFEAVQEAIRDRLTPFNICNGGEDHVAKDIAKCLDAQGYLMQQGIIKGGE